MNRSISYALAATMLAQGCAGRTTISSTPSGATVFVDNVAVGKTPYSYSDQKIIGSTTNIRLEKSGHEQFSTSITRNEELDVGPLVGGFFVFPLWLWVATYKSNHHYTLQAEGASQNTTPAELPSSDSSGSAAPETQASPQATPPAKPAARSKAERLRELDDLKKQKLISDAEYSAQRQRILNED